MSLVCLLVQLTIRQLVSILKFKKSKNFAMYLDSVTCFSCCLLPELFYLPIQVCIIFHSADILTLQLSMLNLKLGCLSFVGFLRAQLSTLGYRNRCFLSALCHLIVRRPNLEVATKRLLHQQIKILGLFQCHVTHGSVSLQLMPVLSIFLRSLSVICYNR